MTSPPPHPFRGVSYGGGGPGGEGLEYSELAHEGEAPRGVAAEPTGVDVESTFTPTGRTDPYA